VLAGCGSETPSPQPSLSAVIPAYAVAGTSDLAIVVTGSNFVSESTVYWNTAPLVTTMLSSTQLQAQLTASELALPGSFYVKVVNAPPGGGISDATTFTVGAVAYPMVAVSQPTNDLAWDSKRGLIYLSVPSTAGAYGNMIAALDPDAGAIVAAQFAGSEPTLLALSDDDQFLYVTLNGASSVVRFALPSFALSFEYSLGPTNDLGPLFALDLQVAPGSPTTSAVAVGSSDLLAWGPTLLIFDDATPRALAPQGWFDSIQWGSDSAHLYAATNDLTSFDFYSLNITAAGASIAQDYEGVEPDLGYFGGQIHFDRGTRLIYSDNSIVVDPMTGEAAGYFPSGGWLVPDSPNGRVFALLTPLVGAASVSIQVFDISSAAVLASIPLQGVQGNPLKFIRWGPRGLAFCTDAGFIYLVTGGFVDGSG
jgi:IPT/TIG domain